MTMRILADENFPGIAVEELRRRGHDVVWVRTANPGLKDREVLAWAQDEQRLVVILDKDFGQLAFGTDLPAWCGIVLFRMPLSNARMDSMKVAELLDRRSDWSGHFSVVEEDRIRMRPLSPTYRT